LIDCIVCVYQISAARYFRDEAYSEVFSQVFLLI